MKKCLYLLALILLITALSPAACAVETEQTQPVRLPDQCGEELYWSLEDGTLTIAGNGAMDDFPDGPPWADYHITITKVVFQGNVTSVGAGAFADFDFIQSVDFGPAMTEIGYRAFKSCDRLESVTLPSSFRRFGEESFMSCKSLTEFHCKGGMPSFNLNCLWDTYATIYYPAENPWPLVHIEQLEGAFQERIEFLASDGTDPYVPEGETQPEVTEPPVTEPEETEPPMTQPETIPVTQVTEPEATTQATEAAPEVPTETVVPTEPGAAPEKDRISGVWAGLFLIAGVLSLVCLGGLIFRRKRYW